MKMPGQEQNIYIVESGSNANGSWVKYSDGNMECRGSFTIEANTVHKTLNYPCEFINGDNNISLTNVYVVKKTIVYSVSTSTNEGIDVYPCDTATGETPNVNVSARYIVKGRWK